MTRRNRLMVTRARRRGLAALGAAALGLLALVAGAPGAQAAAPAGSITPFVSCYFDNGNGTYTVSVGYTSSNSGTVSIPVGTDNRVTFGAQDRGQPTSFAPGVHSNVWAPTLSTTDIYNNVNWSLTGNTVRLSTLNQCSIRPVPAGGNLAAELAFGAVVTTAGALVMGERRRRRVASPGGTL